MLSAPREYGCAHTMPGTGVMGLYPRQTGAGALGFGFRANRRRGFRVWVSRQTCAGALGVVFAYSHVYYHILFLQCPSRVGQEGEDHACREVFPLLTPLSLGFVSASEVK